MIRNILKIMFWLSLPWLYLIALISFMYARISKKTPPTFDALSLTFHWIMPLCTLFTIYLIAKTILAVIHIF